MVENDRTEIHCYSGEVGLIKSLFGCKIKSMSRHQFVDAFKNEGGNFAMHFDGIFSQLTIPWHDDIHASRIIMIFGVQFNQGQSFA